MSEPSRKRRRRDKAVGDTGGAGTESIGVYRRPVPKVDPKKAKDKKVKTAIKRSDAKARSAAYAAARAEILLPEEAGYLEAEGMERTYKFSQSQLREAVDVSAARKVFDLQLDRFGPYALRFSRNGRHVLLGGERGHVSTFDWKTGRAGCELHLGEKVRDVTWLHDESMFATAQRRFTYVYDSSGAEMYVLRNHVDPTCLDFLPYHFLLVSVGNAGWLKYHDVSVGKLVAELRTKLGPCTVMRQNPYNAVMHLGHTNGTVTVWTPNMSTYAAKMLCHRGPLRAVAVDLTGKYMATAGLDGQLKIWDVRSFRDEPLQQYFTPTPATCVDISQRGMLAVGHGPHVQVWRDAFLTKQESPYMGHLVAGATVTQCRFAPLEDVLGVGHSKGYSSLLVPGSGEPNFDALEANPYQTSKQRKEAEVRGLLEKVQPELITLNPNEILTVKRSRAPGEAGAADGAGTAAATAHDNEEEDGNVCGDGGPEAAASSEGSKEKSRARGRNSARRRFLRKQRNVFDEKRKAYKEKLERDAERKRQQQETEAAAARGAAGGAHSGTALARFRRKPDL